MSIWGLDAQGGGFAMAGTSARLSSLPLLRGLALLAAAGALTWFGLVHARGDSLHKKNGQVVQIERAGN
jgi:hypothetical protein